MMKKPVTTKAPAEQVVEVDKEGTIRAQTVFDEKLDAANPEYAGHVTQPR